jgi:flagellar motility protein MotE (MotC chaperone)
MTTLRYGWTVAQDESSASCSPDGNTALEVVFESPGTYSLFFDNVRKAQAVTLLDGMIGAENLYDYLNGGEQTMATKNENSIDNFAVALLNAAQSLKQSLRDIDDLNGRLEELEHYMEHREKLSDEARDTLQEAHEFYMALPVWDTIESLAGRLHDVRREVAQIILEEVRSDG